MYKKINKAVYSKPTMCLPCHLVVELSHPGDMDPDKGHWSCPRCGHRYPFAHWKIKEDKRRSKASA